MMSDSIDSLKEAEKEALGLEERPRHISRRRGSTTGGLILIGLGVFFLLSQLSGFFIHNWWALFILIPAFHNLSEAWQSYREHGRFRTRARHSLLGGLLLTMVAVFFLFNLSWNLFWPLALILAGVSALLSTSAR